MIRLAILFVLVLTASAAAEDLRLDGEFAQGGLVMGTTAPGAEVTYNGRLLRVSPKGQFLFGFGREAPSEGRLQVRLPDGREIERVLEIRQRDYKIQRIDGLPPKMVTPPQEVLDRIARESAQIAAVRAVDRAETDFESGFDWPAYGRISGVYGSQRVLNGEPRRPHYGIDIAAPAGSPVVAPADGIVSLAEHDLYYTGGTIIIDHGHGLTSAFLHMKDVTVSPGQKVRKGTPIGTVGSTGRSTGPHLDWRINWFEERLDPAFLVGPMPPQQ